MSKKEHPVRTDLVVGVLITVIGGIILWLVPSILAWIKVAVAWLVGFLLSPVTVPVLVFGLLMLAVLYTVVSIGLTVRRPSVPAWYDYTEDTFLGVTWRWQYTSSGHIEDLRPYCPDDDTVLVGRVIRGIVIQASLHCETCGKMFGPVEGDEADVMGKVKRQIDRKVRKGEWKQVVEAGTLRARGSP